MANCAESSAVTSRPPACTKRLRLATPLSPSPGRMSSVASMWPRFGVNAVVFHGSGLPHIGRPSTICWVLASPTGPNRITSYFARRSPAFATSWVLM